MAAEIVSLPLPPHSVEAEQNLLGALLTEGMKLWPLIAPILTAKDFFRPDHRVVFDAIQQLAAAGSPPDVVTLFAHLERVGTAEQAGGFAYLSRLARETASSANAEQYAAVIRDRARLRLLAEMGRKLEAAAIARGGSAEQLAADLARELSQLDGRSTGHGGPVSAEEMARELLDDLERRRAGPRGLMTGLPDLDELTGGLENGDLAIFAGRPGMGKTAWLVTVAGHISRDHPVLVFSAEMPRIQVSRRGAALLSGISQSKLRDASRLTDADWAQAWDGISRFGERKLWVDDRGAPPLEHIRAVCIGQKARAGLELVMVDYCQLVQAPGEKAYDRLRQVAYGMKALAKELDVPIVLLAQLNRDVEKRDNKRPMLSDLRDSGAIEEAADIVGMFYREGYYDASFGMPNVMECSLEKHRNGELGQCLWYFAGDLSRMTALGPEARHQYRQLVGPRK